MQFREVLQRSTPQVGTMIAEFATPGIGHILKAASLDFAFLDMEHSGFGMGELKANLVHFQAADIPVILRPPSKARHHISRALDAGANALLLPMVGSAAEAAKLVSAMRYPPEGERGVALGMAHDAYTTGDPATKLTAANRTNVMIPLIETKEGLGEVEAIAKTPGVEALWIGHFDLSASLGIAGQFENPVFTDAVARITAAAKAASIPLCMLVPTPEEGLRMIALGFNIIVYSIDTAVLRDGLAAGASAIRTGAAPSK